jgi:hypothetical protein
MKKLYWLAIGFSGLAILSVAWIAYQVALFFLPSRFTYLLPAPRDDLWLIATLVVSIACVVVSTIGTALTILVGWRNDRRQIDDLQKKLQQAEAQRATAAGKLN